ncbi:helix-turn-helix domain-containing protein [Sphingomonas sp. H39-1-10]|uniref:helix-turn-helix domain-containing protein n=1 Tax=Sphingomonas pollutisoli TaxID=3030829 RepID=UPI0023B88B20|nr:helix-turn-helix domain-containing protein [Sphingomonas pollutisoli]MDF0491415.1 helix-turn-helix domain-containing protein [Sphingomonas pollutisoli]
MRTAALSSPGQFGTQSTSALHQWNDVVGDTFVGCVVDTCTADFEGELSRCSINDMRLVRVKAQPSTVTRWLDGRPRHSSGTAILHLQDTGSSISEQCGRRTTVNPGDGALCDPDERYTVDFPTSYAMFVLELPIAAIVDREPSFDLESFAGRKVDTHRSQILLSFLRTAWTQYDDCAQDPDWRDCVSHVGLDLALRSICRADYHWTAGPSADLRRVVLEHIRGHIGDPALRTSTIAQTLRVSPRSVQSVFERLATTTSGFILQKRLERAARLLVDQPAGRSITDLAFDCGFSDSAYFSRCFRRRYGVSPREYRTKGSLR